jgi:hypothetical protein
MRTVHTICKTMLAITMFGEGMVDVGIGRGIEDPSWVFLVFDIKDMAKAKAALLSDDKKKVMASAGVEGKPVIKFYEAIE